jgi:Ca2+-binding EF-hand superfamily protein
MYGDVEGRAAARNEMFKQMDRNGDGLIGMEEWVDFSMAHISEKVNTLQPDTVDFARLHSSTQEEFVSFLELAMQNRNSEQFNSLYEHLFKTFVEKDVMIKGAINFQEFDLLIDEAAKAPRTLGLAPSAEHAYANAEEKSAARQELFNLMDKDKGGNITFDEYLNWAVGHIAQKIQEYRAGNGYQAPPLAPHAVTYAAPPVSYAAAPVVTYTAPPVIHSAPAATYTAPQVIHSSTAATYAAPAVIHSASAATYAAPPSPVAYTASASSGRVSVVRQNSVTSAAYTAAPATPVQHHQYAAPVTYLAPHQ